MTFENSVFTHVHTVTWPSCWLPPSDCVKVLFVGLHRDQIDQLVQSAQKDHPQLSWCFYFVDSAQEVSDDQRQWMLINSTHVHAVCASLHPHSVITALCSRHKHLWFVNNWGATATDQLVFAGYAIAEVSQLLTQIINHTQESIQR